MQIAAYMPIINLKISDNAAEFSAFIAEVVTFDLPDVDMEIIPLLELPEEDPILSDLVESPISDATTLNGYSWKELKAFFPYLPSSERKEFI